MTFLTRPRAGGIAIPALLLFLVPALAGAGAPPVANPDIVSIGQPPGIDLLWGLTSGYSFEQERGASRLNLDLRSDFLVPQMGFLDVTFEASAGVVGSEADGALSAYLKFPYLTPGVEYDFLDRTAYLKLTVVGAPRRGGILGIGDRLRVDYIPAKNWVQLGFVLQQPFRKFRANRPRNRHTYLSSVDIPHGRTPEDLYPRETVDAVESSMAWMEQLLTPRFGLYDYPSKSDRRHCEERMDAVKTHLHEVGRLFAAEDSAYHANLDAAFTSILGGDAEAGRALGRTAETILLDEVVVPVDRLFGQLKKPIDLSAYNARALRAFEAVLDGDAPPAAGSLDAAALTRDRRDAARTVMRRVLMRTQKSAESVKKRWDDSRLLWLPLNYGLRAGDLRTQEQLDRAMERVVGMDFTACNQVGYLFDEDFYYAFRNQILQTRNYQVTIIHDYRNRCGKGPDAVSWSLVATGYLDAMIAAIQDLDPGKRERLPQYYLFLDEHYYRQNRVKKVVNLLERLYGSSPVRLKDEALQASLRERQARLAEAVAASKALRGFTEKELRKVLSVHVNVTNQFHPAFKEDAITRDHRKIAFRDVREDDPRSGEGLYTGMGIGEYYLGPSWEDRCLRLRGPDLVHLKRQTRMLFLSQGYGPDEVPEVLREDPLPVGDADAMDDPPCPDGWNTTALTTMNHTGFLEKRASMAKMALYNLMPRGSVLYVPDSIWSNDFWGSVLLGASLRGLQVYVVATDEAHAPSDAGPTLELIREVMASLAFGQQYLAPELAAAGGSIHVGLFDTDYDVEDGPARLRMILGGLRDGKLAAEGIRVHPGIVPLLQERLADWGDTAFVHVTRFGEDRKTKLHQKTQFFMTRRAARVLESREAVGLMRDYVDYNRARGRPGKENPPGLACSPFLLRAQARDKAGMAAGTEEEAPAPDAAYFMTIGSQNQDRRGMMLDGEVLVTLAGRESLVGLMDFLSVMSASDWVHSAEEVDRHFPKEGGLIKSITRWIRNVI